MKKNIILLLVLAIIAAGPLFFVMLGGRFPGWQKDAQKDIETIEETRVPVPGDFDYVLPQEIDYRPVPNESVEYQEFSGICQSGSAYSSRADVYTCASGENKFDLCFALEKEGLLLCGIDPENDQTGVIFRATNQLSAAEPVQDPGQNQFFLIKLENGTRCTPMGDINLEVGGTKALYQCIRDMPTAVFAEPLKSGNDWEVKTVTLSLDEKTNNWSTLSIQTERATNVWR